MSLAATSDNASTKSLRDISPQQWRSALAACLGWMFDGLDVHLYTLVAAPFVATLIGVAITDPLVKSRSSWIQAAFLIGWALGGAVFGRIGDRLGRSRTLGLTILTYAACTGLSFFSQTWWQLMIFRFLAALGIGGEWAVGSSLLAETWPSRWHPLAAAVLQTAINIGVLIACAVTYILVGHERYVFLVGVLPALVVLWIRRSVPEPAEWLAAQRHPADATGDDDASPVKLFRGAQCSITLRTIAVCACSLTAWWAFMFWINQHIHNLPDISNETARKSRVSLSFFVVIGLSIPGNYFAAFLAWKLGYRRAIALMFVGFFLAMAGAFAIPRGYASLMLWIPWVGFFSGVFALFTMYLPPLFPTLLRTTGSGLSFNIGRLVAAAGTVIFGLFANLGDFRLALFYNSFLLIPAMLIAMTLPERRS